MNVPRVALSASVALGVSITAGSAQVQSRFDIAGISDDRLVLAFVAGLQRAVAGTDRRAVAEVIQYPMTVFVGGLRLPVRDADALLEYYDSIFTPELKAVIARTDLTEGPGRPATPYQIRATPEGLALGGDLISIKRVGDSLKVTSITVPLPAPDRPAATGGRRMRAAPREPRRVIFRAGQQSSVFSGAVGPGETESYVLWAKQGQLLRVRIERVRGREVVARVLDARGRTPLDARAGDGVREWVGRVPASGDYRIDAVRLDRSGSPALPYMIVVELR